MADKTQTFQNHSRIDPLFHQFMVPISLVLLIGVGINLWRNFGWSSGWHTLAVVWLIVAQFKIRLYSLKVQDRLIRLEERLRMQGLLPEPLRARIGELKENQVVALRFASDGELSGLVEKTLAGNLDNKQIKQAIQHWRPDDFRV